MKLVKLKEGSCEKVLRSVPPEHSLPTKPSAAALRFVRRFVFSRELKRNPYTLESVRMDRAGSGPRLILMNHCSVFDVKLVYDIFRDRLISPVVTDETTAGRKLLVRLGGGIRAHKTLSDYRIIGDIQHALRQNGADVLMFPEAGCCIDGTGITLQENLSVLLKLLKVPVILVTARGTFQYAPMYHTPGKCPCPIHVRVECLLTPDEIRQTDRQTLDQILHDAFTYDHFSWQREQGLSLPDPHRAEGLERILYKCPHCLAEGKTVGRGSTLRCSACGRVYEMTPLWQMEAAAGETKFPNIPDWCRWEKEAIQAEVEAGSYSFDCDGEIGILRDRKALYIVGEGRLHQDLNGIVLDGCRGRIHVRHSPIASYSVPCDYKMYWRGENIVIGDTETEYFFFTRRSGSAYQIKTAAEAIYRYARAAAQQNKRGCLKMPKGI